jgi:hypothetical protein
VARFGDLRRLRIAKNRPLWKWRYDSDMQCDIADPADEILANERGRWPRWRSLALKPAPTWFRGQELDVIGANERRFLFDDVTAEFPRVDWLQLVFPLCWLPLLPREVRVVEAHWVEAAGAVLFIGIVVGTTCLRRRNVATKARHVLRERPDWPQRLDEWRS